jgi:hypothetical protein
LTGEERQPAWIRKASDPVWKGKAISLFGLEEALYGFPRERRGFWQCLEEEDRKLGRDEQVVSLNQTGFPIGLEEVKQVI